MNTVSVKDANEAVVDYYKKGWYTSLRMGQFLMIRHCRGVTDPDLFYEHDEHEAVNKFFDRYVFLTDT